MTNEALVYKNKIGTKVGVGDSGKVELYKVKIQKRTAKSRVYDFC